MASKARRSTTTTRKGPAPRTASKQAKSRVRNAARIASGVHRRALRELKKH